MKKYVMTRKNVCIGQLLLADGTYTYNERNENNIEWGGYVLRGMLFCINENGLAKDLVYETPTNYPIVGVEPKIEVKSNLMIDEYTELEELLKYLNYNEDLTQKDLNRIHKQLIAKRSWLDHHMDLFSFVDFKDGTFGTNGLGEKIPHKIWESLFRISGHNSSPSQKEPGASFIKKRK